MISIQKINNQIVKPIDLPIIPKEKILGYELFPELYGNIFLLGKKKSGKTSTIFTILQKCANKHTNVIIFASTVTKDDSWISIIEWLEEHKIDVEIYTSIHGEEGENLVKCFMDNLQMEAEEETIEDSVPFKGKSILAFDDYKKDEPKEKKSKFLSPEFIIVFDDLSSELKDKWISVLAKQNRHYKMKIIFSSQYFNDLEKQARMQIDYMLMFPNIPIDKIESVHKECDLSIPLHTFLKCYQNATLEKYNFLYVSTRDNTLRKNFNYKYLIKDKQ